MKIIIILLIILILALISFMIIFNSYNKIIEYKIKMESSNEEITKYLKQKHSLMTKFYQNTKKSLGKKDYLQEFSKIKNNNISNQEYDKILNDNLIIMFELKEDYKKINTKENNEILNEIKEIDHLIIASKKFFNKNNNKLMKELKGINKITAKLFKINVKNSYEIKEPTYDN